MATPFPDEEFLEQQFSADHDELADDNGLSDEDEDDDDANEEYGDDEDGASVTEAAVDINSFMLSRGAGYLVPRVAPDSGQAGIVRDHGGVVTMPDAEALGLCKQQKHWPTANEFPPAAVVVVKGRFQEGEHIPTTATHGKFLWFARVVIKGNESGKDRQILRLIPRGLVKNLMSRLSRDEVFYKSTLITCFAPFADNQHCFPVSLNGWSKVASVVSEEKKARKPKAESRAGAPPAAKRKAADDDAAPDADSAGEDEVNSPCDKAARKSSYKPSVSGAPPAAKRKAADDDAAPDADSAGEDEVNSPCDKAARKPAKLDKGRAAKPRDANMPKNGLLAFGVKKPTATTTNERGKQDAVEDAESRPPTAESSSAKASLLQVPQQQHPPQKERVCRETLVAVRDPSRTFHYFVGNVMHVLEY